MHVPDGCLPLDDLEIDQHYEYRLFGGHLEGQYQGLVVAGGRRPILVRVLTVAGNVLTFPADQLVWVRGVDG